MQKLTVFFNTNKQKISSSGMFWLVAWFTLNLGMTLVNKAIFKFWAFPFPTLLGCIHMFFTAILCQIYVTENQLQKQDFNGILKILLFSVLFTSTIVVGNVSLQLANLSFNHTARSTVPAFTMAMSVLILHKKYDMEYLFSVVLVVVGVGMTSYADMNVNLNGVIFTFLFCFLSSLKSVLSSLVILKIPPLEYTRTMCFLATIQCLPVAYLVGEIDLFLADPKYLSLNYLIMMVVSGTMAFMLNLSFSYLIKETSALTTTIAGNVKNVVTILIGIMFFDNELSSLATAGTIIAILGAIAYARTEYLQKVEK